MMHRLSATLTATWKPARLGLPAVIRYFTPNWFAATMGTGILSIALSQFPEMPLAWQVGKYLWLFNIALFSLCYLLFCARWFRHFDEAKQLLHHPVMSMFFGCIPMGLATIVNGFMIFGLPGIGEVAIDIAHALWWLDVGLSLACGLIVPYAMFTRQSHSMEQMTAVWLLPLVASEVAAVSGGLLIPHIADPAMQMTILMLCLLLWSLSVPIALGILVILFVRLALHKLPEATMAASCWLSLGPIGTGALALLVFSDVSPAVLSSNGLAAVAAAFSGAALLGGVLLWGYGLWWFSLAAAFTARYIKRGMPFNLGWWGFTFPLGVFSVATLRLGHAFSFPPIAVLGAILVTALGLIWCIVAFNTMRGLQKGAFFKA
ncbi:TDT family transporter [Rhizobium setariae]|nr:TDT family transporter [Rhizobium setariae]